MWWFDSGRVCLDLVATGASAAEQLDGAGRLRQWLVGAGLVPPGTPLDEVGAEWVGRFTELRGHVAQLVYGPETADGPALERVNALAAAAPPAPQAVRDADGGLVRALSGAPECGALLAAVARDAVELLTDPAARSRLRQCEGDSCRRLFLDTSRGRRRRWCSSEVCGNRERVARHRRRRVAVGANAKKFGKR
ncbi:CGNR zinc finger domain-containing protein [Streptomyces sannanensis]|uniref:CGNR zinc finger domain-containing protein n=1 Tax=Streptomyces sannanensis TaxID=285536 RepID=A0ABP6SAB1_9ACTN